MKILNKLSYSFFLILFCLDPLFAKEDFRIENQLVAFEQALGINSVGTLKKKENGFIYLDIDNGFISEVVPLLGSVLKRFFHVYSSSDSGRKKYGSNNIDR